jgi:hypothetical protein
MTTYTIEINGRGGEMVLGKISKEAYEHWSVKEEFDDGLSSHLFWDPYDPEDGNDVTDDQDPRFLGQWFELDDIEHAYGAFIDYCEITVYDEDNNEVWKTDDPKISNTSIVDPDDLDTGHYIKVWQTEKGNFFAGEFEADSFDPEKLSFYATNLDNDVVVDGIDYDGETIDNDGGDTTGKGSGWEFYENI